VVVNWPPATAPAWPPPGYTSLEFSRTAIQEGLASSPKNTLASLGFTSVNPTQAEKADFAACRCEQGHTVDGVILRFAADGKRYPFAMCSDPVHQQFLVLWNAPFYTV
jgi:hypothetical protein